jgi:hypothetical protein
MKTRSGRQKPGRRAKTEHERAKLRLPRKRRTLRCFEAVKEVAEKSKLLSSDSPRGFYEQRNELIECLYGEFPGEFRNHACARKAVYDELTRGVKSKQGADQTLKVALEALLLGPFGAALSYSEPRTGIRRGNARTITEGLTDVYLWRFEGQTTNTPRKTLADYMTQIHKGLQLGFPFPKHMHEGMGVLRQFTKDV